MLTILCSRNWARKFPPNRTLTAISIGFWPGLDCPHPALRARKECGGGGGGLDLGGNFYSKHLFSIHQNLGWDLPPTPPPQPTAQFGRVQKALTNKYPGCKQTVICFVYPLWTAAQRCTHSHCDRLRCLESAITKIWYSILWKYVLAFLSCFSFLFSFPSTLKMRNECKTVPQTRMLISGWFHAAVLMCTCTNMRKRCERWKLAHLKPNSPKRSWKTIFEKKCGNQGKRYSRKKDRN